MFRRLDHTLPKDPVAPVELEQLGYFINQDDQIRMIKHPELSYYYRVNRNARVNEVYKQAIDSCILRIIHDRLQKLDLETILLPLGSASNENHVPILVSTNLSSKKRIVVLFGERHQDLGVLSHSAIREEGIAIGSVLDFVSTILAAQHSTSDQDSPGIIISNPGKLLWFRGGLRAVSYSEWCNLPRESALHTPYAIDQVKNTIPENRDYEEHVIYIFDHVMNNLAHKDASFDIIGLEYTGKAALQHLALHWDVWSSRIAGICLGGPQHALLDLDLQSSTRNSFIDFLSKRCRAYGVSQLPIDTIIKDKSQYGCNCYSSGEGSHQDNLMVRSWRNMLDWFKVLHSNPDYEEADFIIHEAAAEDSD